MKKFELVIEKPNIMSCIYFFICLKVINLDVSDRGIIDYIIWGISCVFFVVYNKKIYKSNISYIWNPFILLVMLQILGLFQIFTNFSITNIIAIICIYCFVMVNSNLNMKIQKKYINICFIITLLYLLVKLIMGNEMGNTLPGCLIFLMFGFIVANNDQKDRKIKFSKCIFNITVVILTLYFCFVAGARTALFTIPIVLLAYIFLPKDKKSSNFIFYGLLIGCIFFTFIYINIHHFKWYDTINEWSIINFGKQIDSSRPELWRQSLNELKWWQIIFGAGTGKLPSITRYQSASFHNTYIQLLMQNGLIGLSCLILVFKRAWNNLSVYSTDKSVRMVLSIFIGIIIYNCFECTLLQNKAFLGIIEWFVLCMGLVIIQTKERKNE